MSVGDVVADYVLAAGDPAEVLALTLLAFEARGVVFDGRAAGRWRWNARGDRAERLQLGAALGQVAASVFVLGDRWYGFVSHRRTASCDTPEEAAVAADERLHEHRWLLAPGGLPPRP